MRAAAGTVEKRRPSQDKPPYRVMSMAEIAKVRGTNGLKVVSTFSGCGGSCLGFEMAGYDVVWANEFIPAARDVYALNHPGVHLDGRDIRNVTPEDILSTIGLKRGELDVLEGSPPCASFSTAGKREKNWGKVKKYSDSKQRTDDLFFEYVRILDGLQPKVFVAENVAGLVKGPAYGYFEMIIQRMRACGYRVRAKMLDAQWLGVPQMRRRMIFIGVRNDLEREPEYPKPLPYRYTVRDALPWISTSRVIHDTSGAWGSGDITDRPAPTITVGMDSINSCHFKVVPNPAAKPMIVVDGPGCWLDGEKRTVDDPAPTVMALGIGGVRSSQMFIVGAQRDGESSNKPRKFHIDELKRLCGFPDDFKLVGKYGQQWERLGRSVPPVMMHAVAATIRDEVFAR